nr:hypothetical protein [Tanacetum cinerariifolium]
ETPSPSPSLTLPVRKRYRGTSKLILDINSERDELGDEDTDEGGKDETLDVDVERERERLDDEDHAVSEPLGLGYGELRRRELVEEEDQVLSTFEAWARNVDTRMADMSRAGYDDHRLIHDMLVQQTALQRELQEMRGRVTALEQERDRREQ